MLPRLDDYLLQLRSLQSPRWGTCPRCESSVKIAGKGGALVSKIAIAGKAKDEFHAMYTISNVDLLSHH